MGNQQGIDTKINTQKLLEQALAQEPTVRTCKDDYGMHTWVKHEETLMEYCSVCMIRKDVWEGTEKKDDKGDNTPKRTLPEPLRENLWKPGQSGNPAGRPKGSRNLTTIVMETLRAKRIKVKLPDGSTVELTGEQAFAEAVLENAIKKKDRESLRMIWEMADGKPTQQHKLDIHSPKGYQVDPEREKIITEQFGMYDDQIPMLTSSPHSLQTIKDVETIHTTAQQQNTPQNTYDDTQHNNTTVRENTPSQTAGVREA